MSQISKRENKFTLLTGGTFDGVCVDETTCYLKLNIMTKYMFLMSFLVTIYGYLIIKGLAPDLIGKFMSRKSRKR